MWQQRTLDEHKGLGDDELKGGVVVGPCLNQRITGAAEMAVLNPGMNHRALIGGDGERDFDEVEAGVDENQRLSRVMWLQRIPLGALDLFTEVGAEGGHVVVHGLVCDGEG